MVKIVNYTEKSVAVIGDTKEKKEVLKNLGGRFNPKLSVGAGWIFQAAKRAELEKVFGVVAEAVEAVETITLPHPCVYCGTYGKYAAGSIAGAWVDIISAGTPEKVLEQCKKIHKNERDPEFMFQDFQNFPQQFYKESMNAADFAEVIKWYAEETASQKKPQEKIVAKGFTDHKSEYLDFLRESGAKSDDIQFAKSAFCILKLRGLFVPVTKSEIKSEFCVAEGMSREMSEALKICDNYRTKDGFIAGNLEKRDVYGHRPRWFLYTDDEKRKKNSATICNCESENDIYSGYKGAEISELTADELKEYKAADNAEREHLKKRLEKWWKRYGAEHVRAHTFWDMR